MHEISEQVQTITSMRKKTQIEKELLSDNNSFAIFLPDEDMPIYHQVANNINSAMSLLQSSIQDILIRYELVTKAIKVGLWDMVVNVADPLNPDNTFIWADNFRQMLGYKDEKDFPNVLKSWSSRLHPNDKEWVLRAFGNHIMDYSGRTPYDVEYQLQMKTGEYRWFRATGTTIRNRKGEPLRVAGAIFDIHNKKLQEQAQEEYARLEKLNLIGQLAAGISHEIRNPLTTVKGFLQIFGTRPEYAKDKKNISLMISEIDRANSIISDFLSLSKVNTENAKAQNINDIIKKVLPMLQADAFNDNKQVVFEPTNVPDRILNSNEIKQLILNLVRNAIEVTPQGGIVSIRTYLKDKKVVLAIKDQGIGIPAEIQDKIGTPFFTTKETGTGLGLAISIGIARRNNAIIIFETGKNGTTFKTIFNM